MRRSRWWAVGALVALVAAAGAAAALAWRWLPYTLSALSPGYDLKEEVEAPLVVNPGYLGPQACAPCHARRVAEFQATRHFQACSLPRPGAMPPGFAPDKGRYVTRDPGVRFEMTQEGGEFVESVFHAWAAGRERRSFPIALAYGLGGTADEIYFAWLGDKLFELPMAWLHPQQRWGEQPFDPLDRGDFLRTTTPRCLECHNTWVEHVPGSENEYRREGLILGVTCEKCHGPGQDHVAYHRRHPDETTARAIVYPARLSRDRQMDVCGQCHSNVTKRRGPAFSYRPGEPLEAYFRTAQNPYREQDHVTDQVKYLRQSKCFQHSDTLTCVTCHDPHRPPAPGAAQRACLKCHQPPDCGEHARLPEGVRGECVGCHMPRYTRIQVFFHTADDQYVPAIRPHDHRIAVYPEARREVLLAWYRTQPGADARREADRLQAELGDHWLAEADGLRRQYRFLGEVGALRDAVRLDPTPRTRGRLEGAVDRQAKLDGDMFAALHLLGQHRFDEAIASLNQILAVKPDWSKAHAKLGTAYAIVKQPELAVEHLKAAARYDPDSAYGDNMLGWLAYLADRPAEALEAFRRADAIEPYSAEIHYRMALALVRLDRLPEAANAFRQVLAIDPRHVSGCRGATQVLRRLGRPEEALAFARRAAGLTQYQNTDVILTLAEVYADTGRLPEAEATADRALELVREADAGLVAEVRRRAEEIRARARRAPK